MVRAEANRGLSCYLLEDLWENEPLLGKFLEIFSFAKKKNITLKEGRALTPIHSLFNLPLSQQAHAQMLQICYFNNFRIMIPLTNGLTSRTTFFS
jgi:hypothetical protein